MRSAIKNNDVNALSTIVPINDVALTRVALSEACIMGSLECVKLFVEVRNVPEHDELKVAAFHNKIHIVDYLLKFGRNPNKTVVIDGFNAVYYGLSNPIITHRFILSGVNINSRIGPSQQLPLFIAVVNGYKETAFLLLQHGAIADFELPNSYEKMRTKIVQSKRAYRLATVAILLVMRKKGAPKDMTTWFGKQYMRPHKTGDEWLK